MEKEEGRRRRSVVELAYIAAFQADTAKKPERSLLSDSSQHHRWQRPAEGVLKLNTDGAFDPVRKSGGWGFIIRDEDGHAVCSGAGHENHLLDAFHAELKGCLAGLQESARMGIARIALEVDAALVKDALQTEDYRLAATGGIIVEIKHIISSEMTSCVLSVCITLGSEFLHLWRLW